MTGGEGADVFVYADGDGNDTITDYAEEDRLKFTSGTVTAVNSGKNVIFTVTGTKTGKITLQNAADKEVTYIDADGVTHFHNEKPFAYNEDYTTVTLRKNFDAETFTSADYSDHTKTLVTIDASAVQQAISITGNAKSNVIIGSNQADYIEGYKGDDTIQGGKGADTLVGGAGDDEIYGGTGNDSLSGGSGADTYFYADGDGKDTISGYTEEDAIKITKGAVKSVKTSKGNVIISVGSGSITIQNAGNKIVTYEDADGVQHLYPIDISEDGQTATLLEAYSKDSFNVADYDEYTDNVKTIDASAVDRNLNIVANDKANVITGTGQEHRCQRQSKRHHRHRPRRLYQGN